MPVYPLQGATMSAIDDIWGIFDNTPEIIKKVFPGAKELPLSELPDNIFAETVTD